MIIDTNLQRTSQLSIIPPIALIILGLLAMVLPAIPSIAVVLIVGWLLLFNGIVQIVHAVQSKGIGDVAWKLLTSACYLVAGSVLVLRPLAGLTGLTLTAALFFVAVGIIDIVSYFSIRRGPASAWILADGIVTFALGFMIWRRWPANSLWFAGVLVGAGMLMSGLTRLMITLAARKLLRETRTSPSQERRAA